MNLRQRVIKVEKDLAKLGQREKLAQCNCLDDSHSTVVFSDKPEDFQTLMNIPCPAHGFRRLGLIVHVECLGRPSDRARICGEGDNTSRPQRLEVHSRSSHALLTEYRERERTWRRKRLADLRATLRRMLKLR